MIERENYASVGTIDAEDRARRDVPASDHEFERRGDGRYLFVVPEFATDFEAKHVRRERYQLHADLTV